MADQSFLHRNDTVGINFDPRIKLMLLMLVSIFVIGGVGGKAMNPLRLILCILPAVLLMFAKKWKQAVFYSVVYIICEAIQIRFLADATGITNVLILILSGTVCRFLPTYILASYTLSTTRVNELLAGLKKLHITDKIVIPLAVMFRFFPTVGQEHRAITDTMKMRGIRIGGKKTTKMLEYRMIPLMSCSVKIGDELSAAALTRGLGAPCKRTEICEVHFHAQDYCVLVLCIGAIMWAAISSFLL